MARHSVPFALQITQIIAMSRRSKRLPSPAPSDILPPSSFKRRRTEKSAFTTTLMERKANNSNAGAAASPLANLAGEPIDYSDLKAWIKQQETNPKPLTPFQQKALAHLRLSLQPVEDEAPIGNTNWIGLLNHFAALTGRPEPEYRNTAAPNTGIPSRWACSCTINLVLSEKTSTFPRQDAGFVRARDTGVDGPPSFVRKKDAKQYAAKCCVEWLTAGRLIVPILDTYYFPERDAKKGNKKSKGAALPSAAELDPFSPSTSGVTATTPLPPHDKPMSATKPGSPPPTRNSIFSVTTPSPAKPNPAILDMYATTEPATKRVAEICSRLKLQAPQYRFWGVGEMDAHLWDGCADFGADSIEVPDDVGRVVSVYGTAGDVKQRIAEEVLVWLVGEEERREERVRILLGEVGGRNEGLW